MFYHIILPLCFPISFILHNIPIVYKIFSITELHLPIAFTTRVTKVQTLLIQEFTITEIHLVQKKKRNVSLIQKILPIVVIIKKNDVGATVPINF